MTLPRTMTAIEISTPGGPEVLKAVTRPVPEPGPGEVLIRVKAAGVNRPDMIQRAGHYPPPAGASDLPGLEVAGEVVALGPKGPAVPDDMRWDYKPGDKVSALLAGGGYAEYATAPIVQCLPVPDGMGWTEAAGLPETFFTVWTNVFQRGALKPGEAILIHGGSSGIGTAAIQLARSFDAVVFATAGSDEKVKACTALGCARAINYRTEDFAEVIKATPPKGVDVILDMVGGPYFAKNLDILNTDGRMVHIAALKGNKVELDIGKMMRKRAIITGTTLRPRSAVEKGRIAVELKAKVWPLLASGRIKSIVYKTFPLVEASRAHALMESSEHIGKIVLIP
ncbi:MAG: NAD(P)H-quinone oxidoreductase [Alphaproteobacteria bacterium]|nr:NAD(P)H-quinone oxidoreductase [Alphaproteobacteria bacterium]